MRDIAWLALAAVLGGCAGATLPPLAADHPANPLAPEGAPITLSHSAAPSRDADSAPAAAVSITDGYTCPMHPAVHSASPGRCPICGMTLVPVASGEHDHAH